VQVIICIPTLRGGQSIDSTGYGSVRSAIEGDLGSAMMTARAFHHKMVRGKTLHETLAAKPQMTARAFSINRDDARQNLFTIFWGLENLSTLFSVEGSCDMPWILGRV
jgi:hypothetical protein